jgi:hypothetical protein
LSQSKLSFDCTDYEVTLYKTLFQNQEEIEHYCGMTEKSEGCVICGAERKDGAMFDWNGDKSCA